MRYVVAVFLCLILVGPSLGNTRLVPSQYATIQEAIDASSDGDTILVSPGTYNENIDFDGMQIEVRSTDGPEVTIIDGGTPDDPNSGAVASFRGGEGPSSVLEGFTLTNGTGNLSSGNMCGAGVYCRDASPQLINLIITDNHCMFGSGVYVKYFAAPFVYRCRIYGNSATNEGGAFRIYGSTPTIVSCTISQNTASMGGGIHVAKCTEWPRVYNCTICDNTATGNGGGIFIRCDAPTLISNCILHGNDAQNGPEIYLSHSSTELFSTISYSNVEGGQDSVFYHATATIYWEDGMIDADPLFIDYDGNDYRLDTGSPCVNAGTNDNAAMSGKDIDGDPRVYNGVVDMGSDEFTDFALAVDKATIPVSTGGHVGYMLDAGVENAGRLYIILGSMTGTEPGFNGLPGKKVTVPINWDALTEMLLLFINTAILEDFMGVLDSEGQGMAYLHLPVPIPNAAGLSLYFAYALNNPWNYASNPVEVRLVP